MATAENTVDPRELAEALLRSLELKGTNLDLDEGELARMGAFDWGGRDEWEKLKPVLAEERDRRAYERARAGLQNLVREKLILEWLAQHTQVEDWKHRHIKDTIDVYLREDRKEELTEYLADVVAVGKELADKNRMKKQRAGGYVGHAWIVIKGLVRVALVIGIFEAARTSFETVVFAILVLIYNSAEQFYWADTCSGMVEMFSMHNQFRRVLLQLKEDEPSWQREARLDDEREAQKKSAVTIVRFYISTAFIGITSLYALFRLVIAL
jgi:hypothetical protein